MADINTKRDQESWTPHLIFSTLETHNRSDWSQSVVWLLLEAELVLSSFFYNNNQKEDE